MSSMTMTTEPGPVAVASVQKKDPVAVYPWLPCTITVEMPLVKFKVRDLMNLKPGAIVETACGQTADIPLHVNGKVIGWTEFEVVGNKLAVRITEFA